MSRTYRVRGGGPLKGIGELSSPDLYQTPAKTPPPTFTISRKSRSCYLEQSRGKGEGLREPLSVCKAYAWALLLSIVFAPALMADPFARLTPVEQFVLRELKAGREADLLSASFSDRVLRHEFVERLITGGFPDSEIQRRGVSIVHAIFKEPLEVSSTTVPFRVWLKSCEFEGGIDFSYTTFVRDLSFESSHFGEPASEAAGASDNHAVQAFFAGMKVEGTAMFSNTAFYVPVDFTYAEFGTDLVFDDVDYRAHADFDELTVKGPVFFRRDRFAGGLDLADADLFELFLENPASAIELDLSQTHIQRGVSLKNVELSSWKAGSVIANGPVTLDRVTSSGRVNLAHSHFQNLTLDGFEEWLRLKPGMLNLEGFSFDTLDIDSRVVDPPAARMLELINSESVPFSPQPYLELERFLRAHGNVQKADEVYIDMRRRQRERLSWINRPWDFLLDVMLGYGKETWRTVIGAVIIVVVGAFVFVPSKMEWKNAKETQTRYNRFWYSLDEFAPVIDFGEAKNWGPTQDHRWTCYYARFHKIAGWILLPLVVGAITGIVK